MKNQSSLTPQPQLKHVKLFNPNASKVSQDLSNIKTILTKYSMPSTFNDQVTEAFSQLLSKIPRYDTSSGLSEPERIGDFNPFWKQWSIFRETILKLTDQSVVYFYQQFMNERFDEFNEIIEDLNTKPPQNVPLYRGYEKSKKDIQTSFENLQQILLEQFDVDIFDEDEEDQSESKKIEKIKKANERVEKIIKNLQSQRTKIRQIKGDVENKQGDFFTNSSQEKSLAKKQHERCVAIIDEILILINGLPKQYSHFKCLKSELDKAEESLMSKFPPKKADAQSINSPKEEKQEDQIEEEEEDFFEEEEVFLEEENEYESQNQQENLLQSPNKSQMAKIAQQPRTPPPTAKNVFNSNQTNQVNWNQKAENGKFNQKLPMTPQKKPPRLIINSGNSGSIDEFDPDSMPKSRQAPQSAIAIKKLPHIKPLNLEDDALVDTFHGLSFSFSSSSGSSSSDGEGKSKKSAKSTRNKGKKDHKDNSSDAFQAAYKKNENQGDSSVHKSGARSGGTWKNKNENDKHEIANANKNKSHNPSIASNHVNSTNDDDDENEVWTFQSTKTTPPSSPRGKAQTTKNQESSARLRSKSPSSSNMRRQMSNNRDMSSDDNDNVIKTTTRPNSSMNNNIPTPPTSPLKKQKSTSNPNYDGIHSVDQIQIITDSDVSGAQNDEFNTQPSFMMSPFRPQNHAEDQKSNQQKNTKGQASGPQSEGLRQQLQVTMKEKESLQAQLKSTKSELEQLKDDYQTIVVQLQIAYEENKDSTEETAKLNATIEKMTKEKETMSAKIKDLQQILLQTPINDPNDKSNKHELPEKLKKLESSDSNSEDETFSDNKKGSKSKKKKSNDADKDDLNKTIIMYQTKLKNMMYEKEALYDNINKLADDNAQLKEQLTNATTNNPINDANQPYYVDQLKLLEEDQEYFTEELQRVWKAYDSLLNRLNSKSKDDSVYFENSKLHKENDKLHMKLVATKKELQFLKDIRKSSALSKTTKNVKNFGDADDIEKVELKKKLEDEKRKNEALVRALREEKSKTAANIVSEDEHRQLFNAKLTIHKIQCELQKVSAKFVHVKGKNKRLKLILNEKGIQLVRDEMSKEIDAMRDAYESAIEWGYAQQELVIKEQSEKELLSLRVKMLEENLRNSTNNDPFDSHTEEILSEMKTKIEENIKIQHELDAIRELVVEELHDDNCNNLSTADLVEKVIQNAKKQNE